MRVCVYIIRIFFIGTSSPNLINCATSPDSIGFAEKTRIIAEKIRKERELKALEEQVATEQVIAQKKIALHDLMEKKENEEKNKKLQNS